MDITKTKTASASKSNSFWTAAGRDIKRNYAVYLMVVPVLVFYILFCYKPMYGLLAAFQKYDIRAGVLGSSWCGMRNFERFIGDPYFSRNIINTVRISFASILFGFPAPIIFALLINEIEKKWFMKTVQTLTYLPHFISLVVICGMIRNFVGSDGIITSFVNAVCGTEINESLLYKANLFTTIYVASDIWQEVGWGSIIYLAALSGIDEQLYEAAKIDGANKFKQMLHVTLPGLVPTIIILFILRLGNVLNVGFEKIMLLVNSINAEKAEVLSYYIYKKGLESSDYGLATAAGLFNSMINLVFVVSANYISGKFNGTSLW